MKRKTSNRVSAPQPGKQAVGKWILDKCVLDLPVLPTTGGAGDSVRDAYVKELAEAAKSPETLKKFAKRWRNLFLFKRDYKLYKGEIAIVDGTFDAEEAFRCISVNGKSMKGCEHKGKLKDKTCPGIHLKLPLALLNVEIMASFFGAPTDTAFIQMAMRQCPERKDEIVRLF